jgi:hypothetical protein
VEVIPEELSPEAVIPREVIPGKVPRSSSHRRLSTWR